MSREETSTLAASRSSRRAARASLAWAAWLLALALLPVTAGAATTVDSLTTTVSTTQAGSHADLSVSFSLGASGDPETVEELDLGLPPGLFLASSLSANQLCAPEDFDSSECPNGSQVGLITIYADYEGDPSHLMGTEPVYLLQPTAEEPMRLGFAFPIVEVPIEIPVRLRTGSDYGLDLALQELPQTAPMTGAKLSLWGVPGDPSHDTSRPVPGECTTTGCATPPRPPGSIPMPFLTNPTRCGVPLQILLEARTYEQPSQVVSETGSVATMTGCHQLPFDPSLEVALTTAQTNTASGIDLGLRLPGADVVDVLEPAAVRYLEAALPRDLRVAPVGAAALGACTDAEFGLETEEASACPPGSGVGTFSLQLAGIEAPLEGEAFLGAPLDDAHLLLLEATGSGARVKLEALVEPVSAQLPAALYFPELPQIPIRELNLGLSDGASLLVTPPACGTYLAEGAIESWASKTFVISNHSFTLSSGPDAGSCPGPPTDPAVPTGPVPSPPASPAPIPLPRPVRSPIATISTDPPKRTAKSKMKFKFASDRPVSTFECKLDKAPWRRCASPKTVRDLAPGKHIFKVRAMDAAGNRGPADLVIWRVVSAK